MTEKALEILNQDEDGFFLMVEASQIDWAGHAHDAAWAMHEGNAFLEAVHVALQFAKKEQNTLLVIAADHDTGGLSLGCCDKYKANIDLLRQIQATGQWMAKEIRAGGAIKNVVKKYTGLTLTDEEIDAIQAAEKMDIAINEMISKHAFIGWTTTHHTGVDIPVYAYGPGAEQFRGIINNIDFPVKLAEIMNIRFTPDQ